MQNHQQNLHNHTWVKFQPADLKNHSQSLNCIWVIKSSTELKRRTSKRVTSKEGEDKIKRFFQLKLCFYYLAP